MSIRRELGGLDLHDDGHEDFFAHALAAALENLAHMLLYASAVQEGVVPGFLRTLGFVSCVRCQFASCMVSCSRDMSRQRRVDQPLAVT